MTLTKADLIEKVRSSNGLTVKQSADLVESIIGTLKDTLASGEDVLISGFGKLCVKHKAERKGRNPATGEERSGATSKEGSNLQVFWEAEGPDQFWITKV
jgi:integration host factor subunit alpha